MDTLYSIIGVVIFALLGVIVWVIGSGVKFGNKTLKLGYTARIIVALLLGVVFGAGIQAIFGMTTSSSGHTTINGAGNTITDWTDLVGSAYTSMLFFIIVPLVLVSIIHAISKMSGAKNGLAKVVRILAVFGITVAISSFVAILVFAMFNLDAGDLIAYTPDHREPINIVDTIKSFFPKNFFAAISNNQMLPVLFIAIIVGVAFLQLKKHKAEAAKKFETGLETANKFVMQILDIILTLAPYGILGIIATQLARGSFGTIVTLGVIVAATFVAMIIMFLIHLLIAWLFGVSPIRYLKKTSAALIYAFSSRSSAATLPLTIKSQTMLGVSEANSNISSALGTTLGQNGCSGVYPTIVAMLVALVEGRDIWTVGFLIPLVLYVVIASFGSGGGATNSSIMVLGFLGLNIELVVILFAVDFLIDMGRTALNVSDSILAGYVSCKLERGINKDLFYDKITYDEYIEQLTSVKDNTGDTQDILANTTIETQQVAVDTQQTE